LYAILDVGGISRGALYLKGPDDALRLLASAGFGSEISTTLPGLFGHDELLRGLLSDGHPLILPSERVSQATSAAVLAAAGLETALVVPLVCHGERIGALLLGSTLRALTSEDWLAFGQS